MKLLSLALATETWGTPIHTFWFMNTQVGVESSNNENILRKIPDDCLGIEPSENDCYSCFAEVQ